MNTGNQAAVIPCRRYHLFVLVLSGTSRSYCIYHITKSVVRNNILWCETFKCIGRNTLLFAHNYVRRVCVIEWMVIWGSKIKSRNFISFSMRVNPSKNIMWVCYAKNVASTDLSIKFVYWTRRCELGVDLYLLVRNVISTIVMYCRCKWYFVAMHDHIASYIIERVEQDNALSYRK